MENLDYFSNENSFCIDRNHIFQVDFLQKFANKKNIGGPHKPKTCITWIQSVSEHNWAKGQPGKNIVACNNNYVHNISPFPLFWLNLLQIIFTSWEFNAQFFWQISIKFSLLLAKPFVNYFHNLRVQFSTILANINQIFFLFFSKTFANYFDKLRVQSSTSLVNIDQYIFLFFWLNCFANFFDKLRVQFSISLVNIDQYIFLFFWLKFLQIIFTSWEFNSQEF